MARTPKAEDALEDLRYTLEQVQLCETKSLKCAAKLKALITELDDDIQQLEDATADIEELPPEIKSALRDASRKKRSLNREAITLEQAERSASQNTIVSPKPENPPAKTKIKLNPIEVPVFDGDSTKYRLFRTAFAENIENNAELTTTSRWIYLRKCLKGVPAEMLQQMPETAKNLTDALALLDTTYGNPARVVQHLFKEIYSLPTATITNASLRLTQVKLESLLCSLENAGHPVNTDTHLQYLIVGKFPPDITYQVAQGEILPLAQLREKLNKFISARENVSTQFLQPQASTSSTVSTRSNQRPARAANQRPVQCLFCKGPHWSDECPVYKTAAEHIKQVPDRCIKCLRTKHEGPCGSKCRCVYCDEMSHNRSLCPKKFGAHQVLCAVTPPSSTPNINEGAFWTLSIEVGSKQTSERVTVRAVIDSGGAKTIISNKLAQLLGLKPETAAPMQLQSLGATSLPPAARAHDNILIYPPEQGIVSLPAYITATIAGDLPAPSVEKFRSQYPQYNHLNIPPTGAGQPIDLLFGKNTLVHILTLAGSIAVNDQYQLLSTKFGHLIVSLDDDAGRVEPQKQLFFAAHKEDDMHRLWELEEIGLKYVEQKEIEQETQAMHKFHQSIEFHQGRYYVGLPFTTSPPLLSEDFGLAWGRLQSLWPKLHVKPELLQQYHTIIQQQHLEDKIEPVARKSIHESAVTHYIPHHPIVKPENNSTKMRIVYDASAKSTKDKRSLNECLHKGAPWVDDLFGVLLRFRRFPKAVVGDIRQAFLQIGIREADRDAIRFLWLRNHNQPPTSENLQIYRFKRVAFGIISSPFLLFATIAHHLRTTQHQLEKIILLDLYADNIVASLPNDLPPETHYKQIKEAFQSMAMEMTKWASNDKVFQNTIPEYDQQPEILQTVLGLSWHTQHDTLALKPTTLLPVPLKITKRYILKTLASIFDPLGWATPLLLHGKIFLRKLWDEKRKWDEPLPPEALTEWQQIAAIIAEHTTITLQRAILPPTSVNTPSIELHAFVDVSAKACAVVLYARIHTSNETYTTLLAAKSKLTPRNALSIPQLELLALLLGSRFAQYSQKKLAWPTETEIHLWCDSRCAIAWVKSGKILPVALQRQVDEITATTCTSLRYLPSSWNPADVATHGGTFQDLRQQTWWSGPSWLADDTLWPPIDSADETSLFGQPFLFTNRTENKPTITPQTTVGVCALNINDFSSLPKLLTRTAFCIRGINVLLKRQVVRTAVPLDYDHALWLWLLWMQQHAFPEMHTNKVSKPKLLKNIRVSIDDTGLIRCHSRLSQAQLEPNTIHPVLLAKKHPLTRLIILHIHTSNKHSGTAQTLAFLRLKYWLPQGRREIFQVIRSDCFHCRRTDPKPFLAPPPAPLPEFRVSQLSRPFEAAGVDVFGPLVTRNARPNPPAKHKRWVTIFTCTVTRALHLELIPDLNTHSLIEAFRRFAARRGTPRLIVCDNAPQFHAIKGKFLNLWKNFTDSADATSYFAHHTITWKFLPPHAPWMGGHYERLIGSVKEALKRTYGNTILIDRQLETTLLEIEAMLNNRPLTYVDQHLESVIITPNHFLHLKFPAIPLNLDEATSQPTILALWKASQSYIQNFWKHWSELFLLTLRDRDDKVKKKHKHTNTEPAINDIVVVADPPEQRSSWRLARIERIIPSADGRTRSVQLLLGNQTRIVRSILHVAPLGVRADLPTLPQQLSDDQQAVVVDDTPYMPPADAADTEEIIEIELEVDWSSDDEPCNKSTDSQGTMSNITHHQPT